MEISNDLVVWLVAGGSLTVLGTLLLVGGKPRTEQRLQELSAGGGGQKGLGPASFTDPATERKRKEEAKKKQLKARIVQAGLYRPGALVAFVMVRLVLLGAPPVCALLAAGAGLLPTSHGLALGLIAGIMGTLAPSFWLDRCKRARQTKLRRALPDALDVISVCLQGGLSLPGSLARVARELGSAHPMLAAELSIVEREIQMGRSSGDAMRQFADRFDLEELRSMASVVKQAEKFGTSVVNALGVFADSLRLKRRQRAEELAQKAVVKLLLPTVLLIFPGMFVVLLGPAAIQIYNLILKR